MLALRITKKYERGCYSVVVGVGGKFGNIKSQRCSDSSESIPSSRLGEITLRLFLCEYEAIAGRCNE